jgi:HSP20 family protein
MFYYLVALIKRQDQNEGETVSITRWDAFRNISTLQDQINRAFENSIQGSRGDNSALTTWAPAVDIYETENELVVKADLPDVNEKDLDIRVENNMLTIRGERKFEQKVKEENYLRIERTYGLFSRSFGLPNTVNTEGIKAEYKNGVLSVELPKRAESKPKQVKVNVNVTNGNN